MRGDSTGNFNVATTDRSTLWVPLENVRPVYSQPALTKIDESYFAEENFNPEAALIKLEELFSDVDPSETLQWELETPKALKGLVELDSASGQIKLSSGIDKITDLPAGSHRLLIRAKDTSGALGDASGIASGSIRLFIAAAEEPPAVVKGLNLLTQLAANEVNDLYDKKESDRTESEQQVVSILKTLNVEENNRASFLQKLEKGSLAVLSSKTEDKPMVLIDASQNEGALLMDAVIDEAETTVVAASTELLESREIVDTPLGEIEFTIDTQGRDFSVVQLQMEDGGIYMDTLFKTDADGNPLIFESEIISYSEEDGPVEDWLSTLTYGIYNYSLDNGDNKESITTINSNDSSLAANLLSSDPLFDFKELEKIDGSAFLIDLDQNNTIDLINMLLVDQGWFDTRPDVVGLIGDPLIPVSTTLKEIQPEAGGGGAEDTLDESPSDEIDTDPDEADNEDIDTPDVNDQPDNPDNENDSNAELPPVNPDNVPESDSPSLSFESGPKPKEKADGISTPTSTKFDDTNNLIDKPRATNNSQDPQNGIPNSNPNQSKSIENASQVDMVEENLKTF